MKARRSVSVGVLTGVIGGPLEVCVVRVQLGGKGKGAFGETVRADVEVLDEQIEREREDAVVDIGGSLHV